MWCCQGNEAGSINLSGAQSDEMVAAKSKYFQNTVC